MLTLKKSYFLTDHNLNYTDKMSMALGVEARKHFKIEFSYVGFKKGNGNISSLRDNLQTQKWFWSCIKELDKVLNQRYNR